MQVAIGYTYYGRTGERAGGSYVTTEWFHICHFPVWPVRTVRLTPKWDHQTVQELPLSVSMILRTYAFIFGYVLWFPYSVFLIFIRSPSLFDLDRELGIGLAFVTFFVVMALPFIALQAYRWQCSRVWQD